MVLKGKTLLKFERQLATVEAEDDNIKELIGNEQVISFSILKSVFFIQGYPKKGSVNGFF